VLFFSSEDNFDQWLLEMVGEKFC